MKILANENVGGETVEALRSAGHDVAWVRADSPGAKDVDVLARSLREERVLVTFDKDFGELVFAKGLGASCGVVLFRIKAASAAIQARKVQEALATRSDWAGHFSVVNDDTVRMVVLK